MNNTDPIATKAAAKDIADDTIHCPAAAALNVVA